jgi:redox-sensing transcriptional repressor
VVRTRRVPEATVARLPVYQRILAEMLRGGSPTVSSEELAERARVNAAKVRKDFSLFGSFGTRGTGYDTAFLAAQIDRALGSDRDWPVVIVGIGNLGRALANSDGFSSHGFRVAALYDVSSSVVGTTVGRCEVRHVDQLAAEPRGDAPGGGDPPEPVTAAGAPAIGVIATPASEAQTVADLLVASGAASILNFAPRVLTVPPTVLVRYVDLSIELQVMSFYLARRQELDEGPPQGGGVEGRAATAPASDDAAPLRAVGVPAADTA